MNRNEAVNMLCKLVTQVGEDIYGSQLEHDCICTDKDPLGHDHRVHPEVVAFIVNAVQTRIGKVKQIRQLAKELEIELTQGVV